MASLNNITYSSPNNSFYALASQSASNWYTFPSQSGKVLLVDSTGTHTIEAIGNDLFYDTELIAKASDIQDVADWALYPALSTILMNGQIITECSSIQVSTITTTTVAATAITATTLDAFGLVQAGTLATVPGPYGIGDVKTMTVTASGLVSAGSVDTTGTISATSNISGGSLTTTGGLDMTNTGLLRTSNIALSAFGAPPYGNLTSPDGSSLTWNGAVVTTGAAGSASQWANYPAVNNVNMSGSNLSNVATINGQQAIMTGLVQAGTLAAGDASVGKFTVITASTITTPIASLDISSSNNLTGSSTAGDVILTAYNSAAINTGNDISLKADPGLNPLYTAAVNLTAQNGNGGVVNVTANPGAVAAFGGQINITANGGTITIPQPPPDLPISVTVGGEVNIFANTGAGGLYTLTSAVNIAAAGVNSYAGAIPPIGSLAGYNFIYGTGGVSVCAGLPATGIQFPGTTYIYGIGIPGVAGGVRLQSPQGIQMLSDTYIENLYPLDGNGLNIQGRSLPTGYVNITDVATLTMNGATALQTDRITSVTNLGVLFQDAIQATKIQPPVPSSPGSSNLLISGNHNFLGSSNYVGIQNLSTLAFDPATSGAITGVQSINGAVWPPPTGDASLWSQYPATSVVNISNFGLENVSSITGLSSINGQAYPIASQDWSQYPALQNVDISGFDLNNVDNITMPANGIITAAGQLSIIADLSGSLGLLTSGGGDVTISTGNAADIYITTGGAGNNIIMEGDTIGMTAAVGVQVNTTLNMTGNNIINVANLNGSLSTNMTVSTSGAGILTLQSETGGTNLSSTGGVTITTPTTVVIDAVTIDICGADITNVANITNEAGNVLTVQSAVNLIVSAETNLTLVSDSADVTIQGQTGASVYAATGNVTLTADSGEVVVQDSVLNMNTHKITNLTNGTAGSDAVNYGQLTFRDSTEFYVSSQGSDTNNGSILAPFLTIQAAITAAELISSAALVCSINVASGHYTENLTFNKGYVVLNGTLQSQTGNEVCEITGSITINCTGANDVFNRQVAFQGFNITCGVGQSITNTSASSHTVSFQDCKIFVNSVCYNSTASCADARTYFTNVEISQTNAANVSPVIVTNVGLVELERLDLTVDGNAIGVLIGGTSVLNRCSLSTLDNTNTAATLLPLLSFTSTTTSAHSLGNVAFAFTSAVAKTATNAVYINSGVNTAIIMLNNVFTLAGTASSTNYCIGYSGVGSPTIAGVNNTSLSVNVLLPQTVSVQTGITQISYTDINPPNMACYSTTGDQAIAAVNTPQAVTFNTTQFNQGTALVATTRFYVSSQGNYQITWSLMLSQSAGTSLVTSFLKKNGTTVANTGSQTTTFSGSTSLVQVSPNFILSLNAGDYVELWVGANGLGAVINSTGATNGNAATPGAVFNITQIR